MVQFSEFKSCEKEPPKKDGVYTVFRFMRSKYLPLTYRIYTVDYTVANGWNTSSKHTEHAVKLDEGEVWCEITDFNGCPVWNLDTEGIEIFENSSWCNKPNFCENCGADMRKGGADDRGFIAAMKAYSKPTGEWNPVVLPAEPYKEGGAK